MLAFLRVKGFAIIDELNVEFKDGLNVLTGETGAGKSIIISALSSLLNARPPADVVRGKADQAEIIGHCFHTGQEYILKRIIGSQGRSRAFVNENPVTARHLEDLGDGLIQVYGQNESQQLLSKETYVSLVDHFLGLYEETERLSELVGRLSTVSQTLESHRREVDSHGKEADLLAYQLDEIEREQIQAGEEGEIRERLKVLRDAARIRSSLESLERCLYEDEQSVHTGLGTASAILRPYAGIDGIEAFKERIDSLSFDVEDLISSIREYEKELDLEPQELEKLEERLSTIIRLKDKYGKTHGGIDGFQAWARDRFDRLSNEKTDIRELEREKETLQQEVNDRAGKLSQARFKGAEKIESLVTDELLHLSMRGVRFKVDITDRGVVTENGRDEVEFLLSANPGEPLRPLRRVASGGELSRIMLAIKKIIGDDGDRAFVFDEIDAGIGGRVAELVGRRLKELSARHQVICITHLPQIAVLGDHHFLVRKYQQADSTCTAITELIGMERTEEIARMLGGIKITPKTVEQAEEMLKNAQESAYQ